MTKKTKPKKVVKRLSYRARREDLKLLIREFGFWGLPSQLRLSERYGISQQQISKDFKRIFTTLDPRELEKGFTEFLEADKKIQIEMRKLLRKGTPEQKFKASQIILQNEHGFTDLLEKYGKKKKMPEQIEISGGSLYDKRLEEIYQKYHGKGKRTAESNKE